jgi:hypothetical protein
MVIASDGQKVSAPHRRERFKALARTAHMIFAETCAVAADTEK